LREINRKLGRNLSKNKNKNKNSNSNSDRRRNSRKDRQEKISRQEKKQNRKSELKTNNSTASAQGNQNSGVKATRFPQNPFHIGKHGSTCSSHKDCLPGYCCHILPKGSTNATVAVNKNSSALLSAECRLHNSSIGAECAHSCQCSHQLHCFQPSKDRSALKKDAKFLPDHRDQAAVMMIDHYQHAHGKCKVARSDDIHHGEYLNEDRAIFETSWKYKQLFYLFNFLRILWIF